jgi:hypothetical protein
VLDRRLEMIRGLLDRGVDRGELPAGTDTRTVADLVSGIIAIRLAVRCLDREKRKRSFPDCCAGS